MKTALFYYSLTGNVRYVAGRIAERVPCDVYELKPLEEYPDHGFRKFFWGGKSALMKETPSLEKTFFELDGYDHIIIATPVWASTFTPPIRSFIVANCVQLQEKEISAVICSSGGSIEKALEDMRRCLGIRDFKEVLFLMDPKDKPSVSSERDIKEFCDRITNS